MVSNLVILSLFLAMYGPTVVSAWIMSRKAEIGLGWIRCLCLAMTRAAFEWSMAIFLVVVGATQLQATADYDPPSYDFDTLPAFARTLRGAEMRSGPFASDPQSPEWDDDRLRMDEGEYAAYVKEINDYKRDRQERKQTNK